MVSTYTSRGRTTKQGTNDNPSTWGSKLNNEVLDLLDKQIDGVIEVDITGSVDVTLTSANGAEDQARYKVIVLKGTISTNINVFIPNVEKVYFIQATHTGGTVTFKPTASATSVALTNGTKKIVYTNGTDIYDMVNVDLTPYMSKANNLSDLADAAISRTNLGLGTAATTNSTDYAPANSVTPSGAVLIFAMTTPPTGWLECDGSAVSRTTYASLFAAIGTTWGSGGGSSTFNLPDFRGEFLRGWDHGKGTDSGRAHASSQTDAMQGHVHTITIPQSLGGSGAAATGATNNTSAPLSWTSSSPLTDGVNGAPRTAAETRPRNIAVMYCIKT